MCASVAVIVLADGSCSVSLAALSAVVMSAGRVGVNAAKATAEALMAIVAVASGAGGPLLWWTLAIVMLLLPCFWQSASVIQRIVGMRAMWSFWRYRNAIG